MNKVHYLLVGLSICLSALADDTEIYGSVAIDDGSRINSNVLFIMDTSGSMDEDVTVAHTPYDPDADYTGGYEDDHVYKSNTAKTDSGNPISEMKSGCSNEVDDLKEVGKRYDYYQQKKGNKWQALVDGSSNEMRCDSTRGGYTSLLYTGHYLNWFTAVGAAESTRMDVVVDVVKELTESLTDINLGLMRFDRNSDGGMIDVPISDIDTSGPLIRAKLDEYYPDGGTPLEETMYEATRYYRGDEWYFGDNSSPNTSVSGSRSGSTYTSPISASCQKNHIILLTDGAPTNDQSANSKIRDLVEDLSLPSGLSGSCSGNGACMDELAYWLQNTDHSATHAGSQPITTYTIGGFGLASGVTLLKSAADYGGGRYFAADDTVELTKALDSIFIDILSTDSTFTAPAVSVNAFNASEHRDDLFYALFRPEDNVKWAGNLKKYRLTDEGIVEGKDVGLPAISDATGFFNEAIYDFWNSSTTDPDGKNVDEGGMANLLLVNTRNIFTNTEADSGVKSIIVDYSHANGATKESFGFGDNETDEFNTVYKWSTGIDVEDTNGNGDSTESRYSIGDPLHSEPVIVTYGGSEASPESTIFFGTNEGFIHAVNTETGNEEFAFIPRDLHSTQKTYFENSAAAADKPYGMDGKITTWFKDNDGDSILEGDGATREDEHIFLYSGMRRGGSNYYGLNVSTRSKPELLFEIKRGDTGFEELGQTWSGMTVARVMFKDKPTDVLFFGGGYDENQDIDNPVTDDTMGRAIYMVDATSGDLLAWVGGPGSKADLEIPEMLNSIPASVSAIDITGDDLIDYLFAVDTGGRVFRIDINVDKDTVFQGAMIAELGKSATGADSIKDNRRFYNKPNVALVKDKAQGDYLTIAVGSGHRALPISNNSVENRFYVLKDSNSQKVKKDHTYNVVTEDLLGLTKLDDSKIKLADMGKKVFDATSLMLGKVGGKKGTAMTYTEIANMKAVITAGGGWYVEFKDEENKNIGEKVLAESTTFSGAIIFTTFSKSGKTSSTCGPDTGISRVYALSQKWGEAAIDFDGDGDVDASKELSHSGIAPRPVVIYRKGGAKTIAIGTEAIEDSRFVQGDHEGEDCGDDCATKVVSDCEGSNCNVTPVYWSQQDDS